MRENYATSDLRKKETHITIITAGDNLIDDSE